MTRAKGCAFDACNPANCQCRLRVKSGGADHPTGASGVTPIPDALKQAPGLQLQGHILPSRTVAGDGNLPDRCMPRQGLVTVNIGQIRSS